MENTAESGAVAAAFVDLSAWRKVAVTGSDAWPWLNDLVSADVGDLRPGEARRSLLLSPTGRIRAEFTVAAQADAALLLQDAKQPASVLDLLARYVLSSDVRLEDRSEMLALLAVPGSAVEAVGDVVASVPGVAASSPSCIGAGVDLLGPVGLRESVVEAASRSLTQIDDATLETWRVAAGIPRFGVDALEDDLPQEGGFGDAVAFDKGCYLGQEAMAKVRNLGHPRRTLLHLTAGSAVAAGDPVESGGRTAGEITSATRAGGGWSVLAKVRWDSRAAALTAANGVPLSLYDPLLTDAERDGSQG